MFLSTEFPSPPGMGTKGGLAFNTSVTQMQGGGEKRNQRWANPLARYEIIVSNAKAIDYYPIVLLFAAAQARTHSWPFKDPLDSVSGAPGSTIAFDDCVIGTGDGILTAFQAVKTYTHGADVYSRKVTRLVTATVKSGVDGVEQTEGIDWTVDVNTGILTYVVAPLDTLVVTAGFEYRIPCRFDTDNLGTVFAAPTVSDGVVATASFPIVQVRE